MAFIKDRLTLNFDTAKFGSGLYLSPEAQNTLNNSPSGLSEWQRKEIANSTVGLSNYYKNPVLSQCNRILANTTNIRNLCLGDVANNYPLASAQILNLANTANNLILQINEFKYHTDNISGLTVTISDPEAADLANIPNFQSAVSIGTEAIRILYTTESYKTTTPILGSFTSIFVGDELNSNSNSLYSSYTSLSSLGASITSTQVNTIISNLQSVNTFIYTRRTSDWNFFKEVNSVVNDFYTVSKLNSLGNTENYLIKNYIGTDALKANLNNASAIVPTTEDITSFFANTETTVTPATISTQLTSAITAATEAADSAVSAYIHANAAFATANAGISIATSAINIANNALSYSLNGVDNFARSHSASAFDQANSSLSAISSLNSTVSTIQSKSDFASSHANSAFDKANLVSIFANTPSIVANSGSSYANGAFAAANTADQKAVTSGSYANSAFETSNTADQRAVTSGSYANGAFTAANTADQRAVTSGVYANAAFALANSAASGTIDSWARSAANTADQRAVTSGVYANAAFSLANTLASSGGLDSWARDSVNAASSYANSAFESANTANVNALSAGSYANSAYRHANASFNYANTVYTDLLSLSGSAFFTANTASENATAARLHANAAFNVANTPSDVANSANSHARSAFNTANTADQRAVTSGTYANAAFGVANSASSYANGAFSTANSRVSSVGISGTNITVTNSPVTSSGTISISIPQAVGTSSGVQFGSLGVGTAASGTTGEIRATNDITAFYSDDRLKVRLGYIENALEKLNSLSTFYYEPNDVAQKLGYEKKKYVGLSAQEVQKVLPEVVKEAPISSEYLTIQYHNMIPLLVAAIKDLKKEIDNLKR